jgi:hypothetical protein
MQLSPLVKIYAISFGIFVLVVILSRFSMSESATGAHGRRQSQAVCASTLKRARFYADASEQDESLVLAILHACEAKAHSQAAKDLSEKTGVVLDVDGLSLVDEQQDRIDGLLMKLHDLIT